MTRLVFPEISDDLDAAYNNALRQGKFNDDPKTGEFWGRFELLASIVENDEIVADFFINQSTKAFARVSRMETEQ